MGGGTVTREGTGMNGKHPAAADQPCKVLEFKRKKKPPTEADRGPQFYCLKCDGTEFLLYASSNVHCAGCGAHMGNLSVKS